MSPLRYRMIFVVGSMRSGTNWIQRILATHPDVLSLPTETHLFAWLRPLAEHVQEAGVTSPRVGFVHADHERFADLLRDLCDGLFLGYAEILGPNATRIVERSPQHALHMDLIGDVYPDATIVHIIRDGRDVARSILSQDYGSDTAAAAAADWRQSIKAARAAASKFAEYVEIRYEDLLVSPAREIPELFRRIGIKVEDASVELAITESGIPYNVDPHAASVEVGKWQRYLAPADIRAVAAAAGDLLVELGYADRADVSAITETSRSPDGPEPTVGPRLSRLPWRRTVGEREGAFASELIRRQTRALDTVDTIVDSAARGRRDTFVAQFSGDATVVINGRRGSDRGRGVDAVGRLYDAMAADMSSGSQVRGDVHPSVPTYTVVTQYAAGDGAGTTGVLVVTVPRGRATAAAYYRIRVNAGRSDR